MTSVYVSSLWFDGAHPHTLRLQTRYPFHHILGLIWARTSHQIHQVNWECHPSKVWDRTRWNWYWSVTWFGSVVPFCCTLIFHSNVCLDELKNVKTSILYHDGKIEIKWLPYFVNMMTVHHWTCNIRFIALLRVSIWVMRFIFRSVPV